MREQSKIVIAIAILIAVSACRKTEFTPEEYIKHVNDKKNGYMQTETIGEIEIMAQYRTPEYMAIEDIGIDQVTQESFAKALNDKQGAHYILFQIASANKKSDPLELGVSHQNEYHERLGHMMSGLDKDLFLVSGKDTLSCTMHHFERSYHLTHYHNVMLVFERKDKKEVDDNLKLIYDDKMLGIGKTTIVFDKQIANSPKIIL